MFAVIGVVGALLLLVSLVFDVEGILPDFGLVSGPVLGAVAASFGLFGWVATEAFEAPTAVAAVVGLAGGAALGVFTGRVARALMRSPTDATPTAAALVGREGRIVTPVRAGGVGEVVTTMAGQPVKLTATAADDLAVGTKVTVVAVKSPTKVVVEATERFWS